MKATLTIEVPDDFKKGDCKKCSFYGFRKSNTGASPRWCILGCDYDNCPLEIQENKCSFNLINEDSIELKVNDIEPFAKVGRIFVTSPDHWCRTYYDCVDCELYEENNQ